VIVSAPELVLTFTGINNWVPVVGIKVMVPVPTPDEGKNCGDTLTVKVVLELNEELDGVTVSHCAPVVVLAKACTVTTPTELVTVRGWLCTSVEPAGTLKLNGFGVAEMLVEPVWQVPVVPKQSVVGMVMVVNAPTTGVMVIAPE